MLTTNNTNLSNLLIKLNEQILQYRKDNNLSTLFTGHNGTVVNCSQNCFWLHEDYLYGCPITGYIHECGLDRCREQEQIENTTQCLITGMVLSNQIEEKNNFNNSNNSIIVSDVFGLHINSEYSNRQLQKALSESNSFIVNRNLKNKHQQKHKNNPYMNRKASTVTLNSNLFINTDQRDILSPVTEVHSAFLMSNNVNNNWKEHILSPQELHDKRTKQILDSDDLLLAGAWTAVTGTTVPCNPVLNNSNNNKKGGCKGHSPSRRSPSSPSALMSNDVMDVTENNDHIFTKPSKVKLDIDWSNVRKIQKRKRMLRLSALEAEDCDINYTSPISNLTPQNYFPFPNIKREDSSSSSNSLVNNFEHMNLKIKTKTMPILPKIKRIKKKNRASSFTDSLSSSSSPSESIGSNNSNSPINETVITIDTIQTLLQSILKFIFNFLSKDEEKEVNVEYHKSIVDSCFLTWNDILSISFTNQKYKKYNIYYHLLIVLQFCKKSWSERRILFNTRIPQQIVIIPKIPILEKCLPSIEKIISMFNFNLQEIIPFQLNLNDYNKHKDDFQSSRQLIKEEGRGYAPSTPFLLIN